MSSGDAAEDPRAPDDSSAADRQTVARSTDTEAAALGRRVLTVGVLAPLLIGYVLHAALPHTPLRLPLQNRTMVGLFLPQGWAFFTKSPRTPGLVAYQHTADGWKSLSPGALAVPRDWFGFDRTRRAQGMEMSMILRLTNRGMWHACSNEPRTCLNRLPTIQLVNDASNHTVCGEVGFVRQDMRPWAWRHSRTVMPSQVIRAVVACR